MVSPQSIRFALPTAGLLAVWTLVLPSAAQSNLNPTGAGCVDPQGFLDCYSTQTSKATECVATARKTCGTGSELQTCILGCGGAQLAGNIGCWVQSCWNRLYSCEYQGTAIQYLSGTDLVQATVDIPFYPPPDGDLPGGCACNIGNAYGNLSAIATYNPCLDPSVISSIQATSNCNCCAESAPISNVVNICPNYDLSIIGFNVSLSTIQKSLESVSSDSCAVLESDPALCTSTFTFPYVGTSIHNPLSLSTGEPGTQTLSDLPGTAFTSFYDQYTLSLFPGYSSVITPAAYNSKNAAATGGSTGSPATSTGAAAASTAAAAGSSSGAAAASTSASKSGAGSRVSGLRKGSSFLLLSVSILASLPY